MKRGQTTLLFVFLFLLCQQVSARGASVLQTVTQTVEQSRLQIFLRFTDLPAMEKDITGRRVDLILKDTVPASDFTPLAGDDKMIKMLVRKQAANTVLSFYFRYPPQHVTINKRKETASLMLDILTGNPFSSRYPDLTTKLKGVTLLHRNEVDYTNPVQISPFTGRWRALFKEYETPVVLSPDLLLTLPPFPLASQLKPKKKAASWLSTQVLALAGKNEWELVSRDVRQQLEAADEETLRNRLLLTYGEALVRAGEYEEPYQLLQQIMYTYPETRINRLANLLFIYLQAVREDAFLAFTELDALIKEMGKDNPFPAWLNILQAEIAIQTNRYAEARTLLQRDDMAYRGKADLLRLLRQADTSYGRGKMIRALVAYLQLEKRSDIISTHPRSLANFADTLYSHQRYADAASRYDILSSLLADRPGQDLAQFRLAMSKLRDNEPVRDVLLLLVQIQNAFPETEGAYRANLKQTDLEYLADKINGEQAASTYHQIAEQANRIELREEAAFKEALVDALMEKNEKAIDLCMQILRDFRSGRLKVECQALIIERLPTVLKQLIDEQKYVKALVLAKQNRFYFARGWLKTDLLYDLARAYIRLGVYDRAVRTYQYIFDVSDGADREKVYLPLLSALFENEQYGLVEDYADRFFFRYPSSPDAGKVFLFRLKALRSSGQLAMAARLLDTKDRPQSGAIDLVGASIYFDLGRWQDVIRILTRPELAAATISGQHAYELAEAYFQTKQYDKAKPIFQRLQEENSYRDLAMFRLAKMDLLANEREQALNEFRKLAEKGKDPLWIRLAREEIKILQLEQMK